MVMRSSCYNVTSLADLWRRSFFCDGSTANRRKRTGRKCHCAVGLNQQSLSALVEAKRWRGGVVFARREVCRVIYCCSIGSNRYFDREPFRVDAICWQSRIHFIGHRSRIKSGIVILASPSDGKVTIVVGVTPDLTKKVPAGQIVKQIAPIVGGSGGGRADFAEAGGFYLLRKPRQLYLHYIRQKA